MVSHSGTMAASFFSQKRMSKSLGEMYMPDAWRKFLRDNRQDGKDSAEDAGALFFGG
jgi:hypothetical protein